jgi:hypothetical protein
MRTFLIVLALAVMASFGCRTNSGQVLLERDLRLQEDRIWQLESMLDDACAAREATIRENNELKKELTRAERGGPPAELDSSSPSRPDPGPPSTPKLELPKLEVPQLEIPGVEMPDGGGIAPPAQLPPDDGKGAVIEGPPSQLVINKRLTGGLDHDGRPGDEGVLLAFEPRDAQGRLVNGPGTVSVVLVDPALEGAAARLARWNFDAAEVPGHFRNSPFGRGLQFELPWPGDPPTQRDLRLFVRFTTPEGKKITADAPIDVRTAANPRRSTDNGSGTDSHRAARETSPRSRLKSSRPATSPPAENAPKGDPIDRRAATTPAEDDNDAAPAERQATRPDRPTWRPYR